MYESESKWETDLQYRQERKQGIEDFADMGSPISQIKQKQTKGTTKEEKLSLFLQIWFDWCTTFFPLSISSNRSRIISRPTAWGGKKWALYGRDSINHSKMRAPNSNAIISAKPNFSTKWFLHNVPTWLIHCSSYRIKKKQDKNKRIWSNIQRRQRTHPYPPPPGRGDKKKTTKDVHTHKTVGE